MQDKIESDIKTAMLAGDKTKAETLRGLKSAILNEAISQGVKDEGLDEAQMQKVLQREAKKRSEAAELYKKVGESERANAELNEKAIIDSYLPQQMSETEIAQAVDVEVAKLDKPSMQDMGRVIGAVKSTLGGQADGAIIAKIVKEKLG